MKMTMEQFDTFIGKKISDSIGALNLTAVDKKYGVFPGIADAGSPDIGDKKSRTEKLLRAVILGQGILDPVVQRAMSEASDASGGYLVPDEFSAEVIKRLPELSELYPYVTKMPISTDYAKMGRLSADVVVTYDDTENEAFNESNPTHDQVTFTIHKMRAISKASRELLEDSAVNLTDYLTGLFADAAAASMDKMIAIGNTSSSQPEGIYSAASISAVVVTTLTYAKLVEILHTLAKKYRKGSRWLMGNDNVQKVRSLLDDSKKPIWYAGESMAGIAGGQPDYLLGYPISEQDDFPSHWIGFGNLSKYYVRERTGIVFESTTVGGNAFEYDQVYLKIRRRWDGKVVLPEAFVKGTNISA